MIKNTCLFLLICFSVAVFGQQNKAPNKEKAYAKFPYWIQMMDDEKVNYFEALKAFDSFWEHRQKPLEQDEVLGEKNEVYQTDDKALAKRLKKLPLESRNLAFQYRKFLHWAFVVKPYVQEDGSILSKAEQLKIYELNK